MTTPRDASSITGLRAQLHAAKARAQSATQRQPRVEDRRLRMRSDSIPPPSSLASERRARREAEHAEHKSRLQTSQQALERKSVRYRKLSQGLGIHEDGLIDWDAKELQDNSYDLDPDSDHDRDVDVDDKDDPMVEYTDEFGRVRTAKQSSIPREFLRPDDAIVYGSHESMQRPSDSEAIYGPATSFPVYKRDIPLLDTRIARDTEPLHFDADKDIRARGAAFYRFSRDEATRMAQQEELRTLREETKAHRENSARPLPTTSMSVGAARRAARQRVIDAHRAQEFRTPGS